MKLLYIIYLLILEFCNKIKFFAQKICSPNHNYQINPIEEPNILRKHKFKATIDNKYYNNHVSVVMNMIDIHYNYLELIQEKYKEQNLSIANTKTVKYVDAQYDLKWNTYDIRTIINYI